MAALCHMILSALSPQPRRSSGESAEVGDDYRWHRRRKDMASSGPGWGPHVHQRAKSTLMARGADESLRIRPMVVIRSMRTPKPSSGATRRDQVGAGIIFAAGKFPKPIWH